VYTDSLFFATKQRWRVDILIMILCLLQVSKNCFQVSETNLWNCVLQNICLENPHPNLEKDFVDHNPKKNNLDRQHCYQRTVTDIAGKQMQSCFT
jgi:hypothetical protein